MHTSFKKILIIGCGGAGKSTLARELGKKSGLPVHHLDNHYWEANWTSIEQEDFIKKVDVLLKEPQWILDGNYRKTLGQRLPHADLVIFMDMPRRTCLKGILSRMWTYRILGKTRPCTGPNCPEMISKEFFWYVWNFNKKRRPFVYEELKKHEFPPKPLVIIKNRKQAQKFIEEYPNITDYLS